MADDDPRYLAGIRHFNAREFFDAHEVWEELWHEQHGDAHDFVQGLIQFATALHHFEASNMKGARLLFDAGVGLLRPYGETFWKLPVRQLIDDMTACFRELLPYSQAELPGRYDPQKRVFAVQIRDDRVPKIKLRGGARVD
jgi:predicted metal-dependent hydrolase